MNTIIDRNRDEKSCYVRCDCGGEILGFHYNKWNDGDENFRLTLYGPKHIKKDHFSDFYFKEISDVACFTNEILTCLENEENITELVFEDSDIEKKQLKRLGPSILYLSINREWEYIDIVKFKSKNQLKRTQPRCTWDVCLRFEELKNWLKEIKKIIGENNA